MKIFDNEHNQLVLESIRATGRDITLEELIAERKIAYAIIRKNLLTRGFDAPSSDDELFFFMGMTS